MDISGCVNRNSSTGRVTESTVAERWTNLASQHFFVQNLTGTTLGAFSSLFIRYLSSTPKSSQSGSKSAIEHIIPQTQAHTGCRFIKISHMLCILQHKGAMQDALSTV